MTQRMSKAETFVSGIQQYLASYFMS